MSTILWLPTADDVAALLRARTKDETGVELGVWTDATRPTEVEVEALIALAAQYVTSAAGEIAERCAGAAMNATVLHAACLIELSYFPEQVKTQRSPYDELRALADNALSSLRSCTGVGGEGGGGGGGEGFGYHSLPVVPAVLAAYYGDGWRYPEYPATWQQPCFAPTPETPANIVEPEPPPLPPFELEVGHPAEGDPERGLPPIITDPEDR